MNFNQALQVLLELEGGLVDNPADPGGRTNLGVTQNALDKARAAYPQWNLPARVDDLTPALVAPFYKALYWDPIQGSNLGAVAPVLFWQAVNQGVPAVTACVQQLLGLHVDCVFGVVTEYALCHQNPNDFVARFLAATALNYTRSSRWDTFGAGWMRRLFLEAIHSQE